MTKIREYKRWNNLRDNSGTTTSTVFSPEPNKQSFTPDAKKDKVWVETPNKQSGEQFVNDNVRFAPQNQTRENPVQELKDKLVKPKYITTEELEQSMNQTRGECGCTFHGLLNNACPIHGDTPSKPVREEKVFEEFRKEWRSSVFHCLECADSFEFFLLQKIREAYEKGKEDMVDELVKNGTIQKLNLNVKDVAT